MNSWSWIVGLGMVWMCVACSSDDTESIGGDSDVPIGETENESPEVEETDPFAFDPPDYDYPYPANPSVSRKL